MESDKKGLNHARAQSFDRCESATRLQISLTSCPPFSPTTSINQYIWVSTISATHEVAPDALPFSGQEYEQLSTSNSNFVALVSKLSYLHTTEINLNGLQTLKNLFL